MQLAYASRKNVKIKLALQGPSGSGKTMSALLLAYGLCNDWTKIAVIDTENRSSELFAHLGTFQVLPLETPFTPERYILAIELCEKAGAEVIVVDSTSHEWFGTGGILHIHSGMKGNSYMNWNSLTPRHDAFMQAIIQSSAHIISTIRTKPNYLISERNGKVVPERIGMKAVTREGTEYEYTIVFELNMQNEAIAKKDRTNLFRDKPGFVITSDTGHNILKWCNEDSDVVMNEAVTRINACKSLGELLALYETFSSQKDKLTPDFTKKKLELNTTKQNSSLQTFSTNGSSKL